jgi:hypothetical protein
MASFARTVARSWLRLRVNLATAAICELTTTGSENHHERESEGVDMQVLIYAEKSVDHKITLGVVFLLSCWAGIIVRGLTRKKRW